MFAPILDKISQLTAFFPPCPPTYSVERHGDGRHELYVKPKYPELKVVPNAEVTMLPVGPTERIVAVFVPAPVKSTQKTVLYSHGNASDIGQILPNLEVLAKVLGVNVVSYDYRGYGCSDGTPSMTACMKDISVVTSWLCKDLGKSLRDIVLLGQSIGSGPSSWFASRNPDLAGIILQSAFLSGLQVLYPNMTKWPGWLDVFPNKRYVPKISSKTLVIHGTRDVVIDMYHGKELHRLCRNPSEPLWADGKGHEDVELHHQYLPTLNRYLREVFQE